MTVALTALAAPGLARLRLRTDGHALVPPRDPAVLLDAAIREKFDLRDQIIVFITSDHPDGIFNPATLRSVRELSEALAALEPVGPQQVMSLATEQRDRVYPGTLRFRPFLEPLPDSPAALAQLRSDVDAAQIVRGTLVSYDARSVTVLVGAPPAGEAGDRVALVRTIRDLAEAHRAPQDRVAVVGAPVAEALLGVHLLEDLALLVPLAIALIGLLIWWGCRRAWGVLLGLGEVGACLVWTFGVMGWSGVPVYLTIAVLPVILTTIGLADEIHIFWHYQRVLGRGATGPHPAAVEATMQRMARPVLLTSLTTAIGFLSFLASPIAPVRVFGVFAAAGILYCMLWSLTIVPAALALIAPGKMRRPETAGRATELVVRGAVRLIERRRTTLALLAGVTLVASAGLLRLHVQDSWIGGFAERSAFRRATEEVNAGLHGAHLLLARLAFPQGDPHGEAPLLDPELLRALGGLESFVRERPGVGGVLGPYAHLTAVNFLLGARRGDPHALPEDARGVKLLLGYFDKVRGKQRRRQILSDDLHEAVVTIFLRQANYRDTATLMAAVREYAETRLGHGVRLDFAGDVAVSQAMIPAVVGTQVRSVLLALALSWVVVTLVLRSVRVALLAILPSAVAMLWILGLMGWLGIPLGVATSMFCAITLGIGVDYAIHFLEGVRRFRSAGNRSPVHEALAEVGPAIVTDTLALALGFGLLAASSAPANAYLGLLVGLALTAGCVLTLGGLGALLAPREAPDGASNVGPSG